MKGEGKETKGREMEGNRDTGRRGELEGEIEGGGNGVSSHTKQGVSIGRRT